MPNDELFGKAFGPEKGTAYRLSYSVREAFRGKAIVEGLSRTFDLEEFAAGGRCEARRRDKPHPEIDVEWSRAHGLSETTMTGLFDVAWRGHELVVVKASWREEYATRHQHWIIAE